MFGSDFTQTPFPADTPDEEEIDVVVMDFALADFRKSPCFLRSSSRPCYLP